MKKEVFDFGFTAVDAEELEEIQVLEQRAKSTMFEVESQKTKVEAMYSLILPLIENLLMDPNKSYIHWPNRKEKLELFKKKLLEVVNS